MKGHRLRPAGVSLLLEVIFGLAVFSTTLLLVISVFPTAHRAVTQAKNVATANYLAREYIDIARTSGYGVSSSGPVVVSMDAEIDGKAASTDFEITTTVTTLDMSTVNERKDVQVTVAWTEGPINRWVELETFLVDI